MEDPNIHHIDPGQLWEATPSKGELDPVQKKRMWRNIEQKTHKPSKKTFFWIAASIAFVILAGAAGLTYWTNKQKNNYEEIATAEASKMINLKDNTQIILGQYSKLRYPKDIETSDRDVVLEGNAIFKVKHNGKSFTVNSGGFKTRVLGTFFKVSVAPNNMEAKVSLFEGKVETSYNGIRKSILRPGEQWWYNVKTNEFKLQREEDQQSRDLKLDFKNTPLVEVLQQISMMYGIKVNTDKTIAETMKITGTFYYTSPMRSLEEMGFPFGLTVEKINEKKYEIK